MGLALPFCFGFIWALAPACTLALLTPFESTTMVQSEVVIRVEGSGFVMCLTFANAAALAVFCTPDVGLPAYLPPPTGTLVLVS